MQEECDQAGKDASSQQATLLALINLQQSLQQIGHSINQHHEGDVTVSQTPGLNTAAATLTALSINPQEASPGLAHAFAVLTQLADSPESAGEKPGMEAAMSALQVGWGALPCEVYACISP